MKIDRNLQLILYYTLAAILVAVGVIYFLKNTEDQKAAIVQSSNLNFNTIIQNIGYYKIGNRGSFLNVYVDSNGKVNVDHRTVDPFVPNALSRTTIPHGFISQSDDWIIYVKNESEVWLKYGNRAAKWFDAGAEGGIIGYDLNDKKRYDKLPAYVINNLLTKSEVDRLPKAIAELKEEPPPSKFKKK